MKRIFILVVVAAFAFSVLGMANCGSCGSGHATEPPHKHEKKVDQETFTGTLVCLGCDFKKAEGARAACTAYGHKHALKTKDGQYFSFLENDYSVDLIKGEKYHNKKLTVQGVQFAAANLIDVKSFEVEGKTKSWCNHCNAMDGCGSMTKK